MAQARIVLLEAMESSVSYLPNAHLQLETVGNVDFQISSTKRVAILGDRGDYAKL